MYTPSHRWSRGRYAASLRAGTSTDSEQRVFVEECLSRFLWDQPLADVALELIDELLEDVLVHARVDGGHGGPLV